MVDKRHVIMKWNLFYAWVCSESEDIGEVQDWLDREMPSGTDMGWTPASGANQQPVRCDDNPKRTHYQFAA